MVSFLTFLSSVLRAAGFFGHSTVDLSGGEGSSEERLIGTDGGHEKLPGGGHIAARWRT